tara:strand:- start:517 stop:1659 length:1143 start_codon:yes stop_codon:yes gene_type:complete
MSNKKIILIINSASFFLSHRLNLFYALKNNNYKPILFIGSSGNEKIENQARLKLNKLNINFVKLKFLSSSTNIFFEISCLYELIINIKLINPRIIYAVSNKPILLGGISSFFFKKTYLFIAFSGLGYIYTEINSLKNFFIKKIFNIFLQIIFLKKNKIIITQNIDDSNFIKNFYNTKNFIHIVKGSGINTNYFKSENVKKDKVVLFPGRLLIHKGIIDFIEASKILKLKFPEWKFVVIGGEYSDNPSSIRQNLISDLKSNNSIEFISYSESILEWYNKSMIVCLPSYREGMPKSILEASSCKCAIVTTNVPGCKEAIINNQTGLLVEKNDIDGIVDSVAYLIKNNEECSRYGHNGREYMLKEFDEKIILSQFINIFKMIN